MSRVLNENRVDIRLPLLTLSDFGNLGRDHRGAEHSTDIYIIFILEYAGTPRDPE